MKETNEEIKERLNHTLDSTEKDNEYAAKILCGLNPLDDWSELDNKD